MTEFDTHKLIRVHQKISAARSKLKAEYDVADGKLKEQLATVEAAMLQFLNETKQKTAKSDNGYFYWEEKMTPSGSDWKALFNWVKKEDAFDVFHKRLSSTFIKTYMEGHDKALPPGVSIHRERIISVRKN